MEPRRIDRFRIFASILVSLLAIFWIAAPALGTVLGTPSVSVSDPMSAPVPTSPTPEFSPVVSIPDSSENFKNLRLLAALPSDTEPEKIVDLMVPKTEPVMLNTRRFAVPVAISPNASGVAVDRVELLFSDDLGGSWNSAGKKSATEVSFGFPFEAPRDGEFWFAFRFFYPDETDSVTKVQKMRIAAGTAPMVPVATTGGLSLLSGEGDPSSPLGGNSASGGASGEEKPTFPGEIADIQLGKLAAGAPTLSLRWFRPDQFGEGADTGGKLRIERSPNADGPWGLVTRDAVNLPTTGNGFWFALTPLDTTPFYLRTVMVDSYGKEWVGVVPQKIDLSQQVAAAFSTNPVPSSATDGVTNRGENSVANPDSQAAALAAVNATKPMLPIEAWTPDSQSPEKKELAAALADDKNPVVNKTASVSQTPVPPFNPENWPASPSNSSGSGTASGSGATATAPTPYQPLTDPGQISINPLFSYGFGIFTKKGRDEITASNRVNPGPAAVPNPSDYAGNFSGAYSNPYNAGYPNGYGGYPSGSPMPQGAGSQQPAPPSPPVKRSIFMSPQEYQQLQQASVPQNRPAAPNPYANGYAAGYPGGYPMPGQVIYQDAQGNVISNPFVNASGGVMNPGGGFPPSGTFLPTGMESPVGGSPTGEFGGDSFVPMVLPDMNMSFPDMSGGGATSGMSSGLIGGPMGGAIGNSIGGSIGGGFPGGIDYGSASGPYPNSTLHSPPSTLYGSANGPYSGEENTLGTVQNRLSPPQSPMQTLPPRPQRESF